MEKLLLAITSRVTLHRHEVKVNSGDDALNYVARRLANALS